MLYNDTFKKGLANYSQTLPSRRNPTRGPWTTSLTWQTVKHIREKPWALAMVIPWSSLREKNHNLHFENWMSFTFKMLTLLHKRMICAKFGRNRPSCSGKEEFLIFGNFFSYLKGAWPFSFTSLSYFYLSARIQIWRGTKSSSLFNHCYKYVLRLYIVF